MSLEARKLSLIQDFLNIQNEEFIYFLEKVFKKKNDFPTRNLTPMSLEKLEADIRQALLDGENEHGMLANEVREKYGL